MTIAMLSTGDELTHGDTLNTTSQVLAHALSEAGFPMGMHVVCGDKEQELLDAMRFLAANHQVLIITGGLGPTSDDRTRFALAAYLNTALVSNSDALLHIEQRLAAAKLGIDIAGQADQALFPTGAMLFDNPHGTAMGCAYEQEKQVFILLPGPPKECLFMFEHYALPYLKQKLTPSDKVCLKWQLFGVPEGAMAAKLEDALVGIPCQVGYRLDRSEAPYLEFKVRCTKDLVIEVQKIIEPLVQACS
ncbi:MAG: competence/damage-inducible protein A [Gammaproteobacteria bacterium]|nr:competence/damage-inducible protein A [Gammaproteobacteria bacterium]MCH9716780.1 competence/damage-inducible protein A [Gammaproteobacteria bacterium]MCH9763472.1 competence/damage-inducible protein A [Gammaproteobacteria bacterium]